MGPPDFIAFVVALLAFIVSGDLASLVGPYIAIVVIATAGATLSLSTNGSRKGMTLIEEGCYVAVRAFVAVVLTVALAKFLQKIAPWCEAQYTLIPVAFLIGWIQNYRTVKAWLLKMVYRKLFRLK